MITLILLICHKGLPGVCAFAQSFIKIINKIGKFLIFLIERIIIKVQ